MIFQSILHSCFEDQYRQMHMKCGQHVYIINYDLIFKVAMSVK